MSSLTTLGNQRMGLVGDSSKYVKACKVFPGPLDPIPWGEVVNIILEEAKALGGDVTITQQ